jgi:alpha-ketoglutarate-dependent taurine dioxygenase
MFCISVFRNQCFSSLPLQDLVKYGSFFGRNPVHTVMRNPPSHPEIAVVFHGAEETNAASSQWHTNSTIWHSDVSYENQPPGTTFLYHLQGPPCGGDTLFVNQGAAFRRPSPAFQQFLRPLRAVHSGTSVPLNINGHSISNFIYTRLIRAGASPGQPSARVQLPQGPNTDCASNCSDSSCHWRGGPLCQSAM